jgi:hypothetical protein
MALLYIDGFEGYGTSTEMILGGTDNPCRFSYLGSSPGYTQLASTPVRTTQVVAGNSRSLRLFAGLGEIGLRLPNLTEVIIGFGVYFETPSSTTSHFLEVGGSAPWTTSQGIVLAFNGTSGLITACINGGGFPGTVLGTASGTYAGNTWYYLEARVKLGASTGEIEVRVNNAVVLNLTNVNTATGSLTSYTNIGFDANSAMNPHIDDLYVCDKTGSTNNNFLGPVSVYTLMPNGAGSTTNLTPVGAASNWQAVSEIAADTTTYAETNTTGNKDYYAFQDLPAGITTVFGVATRTKSSTPDNGGRKVRLNMKNGASVISSAFRTLTMSSWFSDIFLSETAPDGSAWTKTSVDATEAGPEAG